jgi:hypothetical protein
MLIFVIDFIVENNGNHQTINPINFNYFRYGDYQQLLDKQSLKVTTSYMNMEVDSTLKILGSICQTITFSVTVHEFRTVNQRN